MAAITVAIIFAVHRNYVAVTLYRNVREKYGIIFMVKTLP